jgi:hypothetical protein
MEVIEGSLAGLPTSDPWWLFAILVTNCEKPTPLADDVAFAWPYFDPSPGPIPGGVSEFTGEGPTFITLDARKYAGKPRQDEDTRGDRLDWLIECLAVLGDKLNRPKRVAFEWLPDAEERKVVEAWGGASMWVRPPRPTIPKAPPPL